METFRDFIIKEFTTNGYDIIGNLENILLLKNHVHEDYWLIAEDVVCYQEQANLFQKIQNSYYPDYPLAEKNISLLILYDAKSLTIDANEIIAIENDPIYFKKYMLAYTYESYISLMDLLANSSVADLAMNNDIFSKMMGEEELGPATLLYNIMHKLPFIPLRQQTVDNQKQNIFFSAKSNAGQLIGFLDSLPDQEDAINQAIWELVKVENNEEIDN